MSHRPLVGVSLKVHIKWRASSSSVPFSGACTTARSWASLWSELSILRKISLSMTYNSLFSQMGFATVQIYHYYETYPK